MANGKTKKNNYKNVEILWPEKTWRKIVGDPLGPVLTMFRKSKSEKIKIKIGLLLVEVLKPPDYAV